MQSTSGPLRMLLDSKTPLCDLLWFLLSRSHKSPSVSHGHQVLGSPQFCVSAPRAEDLTVCGGQHTFGEKDGSMLV